MENADSASGPIETLSFAEFREVVYTRTMYFYWKDDDDIYAVLNLGSVNEHARSAEWGCISLRKRGGHATASVFALFRYGFRTLGLNKMYCVINADNEPILAMCEKFKDRLTREATLRQARFKNGKFVDQYIFSVLLNEEDKWADGEQQYRQGLP